MSQSALQTLNIPNENLPGHSAVDDEVSQLRKQLRAAEAECKKTKAVLEQKVEQLEAQLGEYIDREKNLKQMNETIMGAISDLNTKSDNPIIGKAVKELELATEQHHKEMAEYRTRTTETLKGYEFENKKLKENLQENENLLRELKLQFERNQLHYSATINELENEKSNLDLQVRRLEDERRQHRDLQDYEIQLRLNELKSNNEKIKEDHRREVEKLTRDYDKSLHDLKLIYEDEKKILEQRLDKTQALLKQNQLDKESGAIVVEMQATHQREIESLNKVMLEIRARHQEENEELKRQRDEAVEKAEKAEGNVKKLRVALRNSQSIQEQNNKLLKTKLDKASNVMEQGENIVEENKKYKQKIIDLKNTIKRLETNEKKLKDLILDKEITIDEERLEFKRMMSSEKLLASSVNDITNMSSIAQSRILARASIQNPMDDDLLGMSALKVSQSFISNKEHSENTPIRGSTTSAHSSNAQANLTNSQLQRKYSSVSHHTPSKSLANEIPTTHKSAYKSTEKRGDRHVARTASIDTSDIKQVSRSQLHLETSFADVEQQSTYEEAPKRRPIQEKAYSSNVNIEQPERLSFVEKKPKRNIDIDSIPINYQEFVKKTERSRLKTESEHSLMVEAQSHIKSDPIIVTTANDEQPQFGTSHFMMHHDDLLQDIPTNEYTDQDYEALLDRETDDDLPSENRFSHVFKKKNHTPVGRSFTREDLDARHSIMLNPMQSVQEYDIKDTFETQFSTDMISSKQKTTRRSVAPTSFKEKDEEKKPSESRSKIEERLKGLEHKLKEMELKNQGLKVEKDKVQIEFEKLMFELKQAKADTSMLDGAKEEKELALKNEIKFLINKLLKVKNKLEKQSEELNTTKQMHNSQSSLNYSQMNSSMALPQNSISYFPKEKSYQMDVSRSYMGNSGMSSSTINRSYTGDMENFDLSETRSKTSLGAAIENFAKNIRSKSNMRYDHGRVSEQGRVSDHNRVSQNLMSNCGSTTSSMANLSSHRARTPLGERPTDYKNVIGSVAMNREMLRDSINQFGHHGNSSNYSRKSYK